MGGWGAFQGPSSRGWIVLWLFLVSRSRTALATFHEGKHHIGCMDMDPTRGLMVTCGSDRIVKVSKGSGAAGLPNSRSCC